MTILSRVHSIFMAENKLDDQDFPLAVVESLLKGQLSIESVDPLHLFVYAQVLNAFYRSGEPIVSDAEYDIVFNYLLNKFDESMIQKLDLEFDLLGLLDSDVNDGNDYSDKEMFPHKNPMLSTDKAYSKDELLSGFCNTVFKELPHLTPETVLVRVTPKLDGVAGSWTGTQLLSRGNYEYGYDISRCLKRGVQAFSLSKKEPIKIREGVGEIVVNQTYFNTILAADFEHPRNFVSGLVKADTLNEMSKQALEDGQVYFAMYDELPAWEGTLADFLESMESIVNQVKESVDVLLDGIIIELKDADLKAALGRTNRYHRWQVALKDVAEEVQTEVLSITLQTGRTGKVTPVGELKPVYASGAMISRATLHNHGFMKTLNIAAGATVRVVRSGEVIPKVTGLVKASSLPESDKVPCCPSCNSELILEKDTYYCKNLGECSAQTETRLIHWFKTIGQIDGFGPVAINRLFTQGKITEISQLFSLSHADLVDMGFGEGESKNLIKSLNYAQVKEIDDYKFLAGLGIRYLGRRMSQRLLGLYSLNELIMALETDDVSVLITKIQDLEGFGDKVTPFIVNALISRLTELKTLMSIPFVFRETKVAMSEQATSGFLFGKKVVFTGSMQRGNREEMQDEAKRMGASIQSSVNKKTDLLVVGEKAGSKLSKALSLGITVLTEDEYLERLASIAS